MPHPPPWGSPHHNMDAPPMQSFLWRLEHGSDNLSPGCGRKVGIFDRPRSRAGPSFGCRLHSLAVRGKCAHHHCLRVSIGKTLRCAEWEDEPATSLTGAVRRRIAHPSPASNSMCTAVFFPATASSPRLSLPDRYFAFSARPYLQSPLAG